MKSLYSVLIICVLTTRVDAEVRLDTHLGVTDAEHAYLAGYKERTKRQCKEKFVAPELTLEGDVCNCEGNSELAKLQHFIRAIKLFSYAEYEDKFFKPIRKQQYSESLCAKDYLALLDQSPKEEANSDLSIEELHKGCLTGNMYLAYDQSKKKMDCEAIYGPINNAGQSAQKAILTDIYSKCPEIKKNTAYVEHNSRWKLRVESQIRLLSKELDDAKGGYQVAEAQQKLNSAVSELKKSENYLFDTQKKLGALTSSIWSGNDPRMEAFINLYCQQDLSKLTKDDFLKRSLDRKDPFSLQQMVVDPMKIQNQKRLINNSDFSKPLTKTGKSDLVLSGAVAHPPDRLGRCLFGLGRRRSNQIIKNLFLDLEKK